MFLQIHFPVTYFEMPSTVYLEPCEEMKLLYRRSIMNIKNKEMNWSKVKSSFVILDILMLQ